MRLLPMLAISVLVSAGADVAQAQAIMTRGCGADVTCPVEPIAGTVVVDLDYDGLGNTWKERDGILRSDEIQCAIDCLDGDPDPEHLLTLPRKVYDPVRSITGGTLLFLPERPTPYSAETPGPVIPGGKLRYEVERPLILPFTYGSLHVRGEGAVLNHNVPPLFPDRAIFRRVLPKSFSPQDVEYMMGNTDRWTISGFLFRDANAGNPGPPSVGIELHGAYHLLVDRCRFEGFDRSIELHFCLFATIRDCEFVNGREEDLIIADGTNCGTEPGPCWVGTEGWLRESGSHQARVLGSHFMTHGSATTSVHVINSMNPVLDGCTFEGGRPKNSFVATWKQHAAEVTLRDTYVELVDPPRPGSALFRFEHGGVARLDGFNLTSGHENDLVVDLSGATDLRMSVNGCGWLPKGARFSNGANKYANWWTFHDISAIGMPLLSPERWGGAERVPLNVTIDGERVKK